MRQKTEIARGIDPKRGCPTLASRPVPETVRRLDERTVGEDAVAVGEVERVQNGDRPAHGIELKDRAESTLMIDVAEPAARARCTVEVAIACLDHVGGWSSAVAAA